jgi:hypothetical protein
MSKGKTYTATITFMEVEASGTAYGCSYRSDNGLFMATGPCSGMDHKKAIYIKPLSIKNIKCIDDK